MISLKTFWALMIHSTTERFSSRGTCSCWPSPFLTFLDAFYQAIYLSQLWFVFLIKPGSKCTFTPVARNYCVSFTSGIIQRTIVFIHPLRPLLPTYPRFMVTLGYKIYDVQAASDLFPVLALVSLPFAKAIELLPSCWIKPLKSDA